jgi:hypothetical protein
MKFVVTPTVVTRKLAADMYGDLRQAGVELVINGLDSANRRGVMPIVRVKVYEAGEHPLSPEGQCLTILDNGTGFTPEVVAKYVRIAESARDGHGRHGLGKFGAFALGSQTNFRYHIMTGMEESGMVLRYDICGDDIFKPEGFAPVEVGRKSLPGLPYDGTFAQIVIPDFSGQFTVAEFMSYLSVHLPHTQWEVYVNDMPVKRRPFKPAHREELPEIAGIDGRVLVELAKAEDASHSDSLWLMDRSSSRPVVQIAELPGHIRRRLPPILNDILLIGFVWVAGLEDHSSGGREGMSSDFWGSEMGRKLIDILTVFVAPPAQKLIGVDEATSDTMTDQFASLQTAFSRAFGAPDVPYDFNPGPGDSSRTKSGKTGGSSGKKQSPSEPKKSHRGTFVKVEGVTYQVLPAPMGGVIPSEVRRGDVIVLNMQHPDLVRLQKKRSSVEIGFHLRRAVIEAHVAHTYGSGEIRKSYELKATLESGE